MKKFTLVLMGMFLMLFGTANVAKATVNEPKDFVGKWEVVMLGLPDGDTKMTAEIKLDGNKLEGAFKSDELGEVPFDITVKDKAATIYFTASGYDVQMYVQLKDDDNATGDLMNMFDVTWKRIKE